MPSMPQRSTATDRDLDWLLDRLVDQVVGTRHAIVLSDDGLVISQSKEIDARRRRAARRDRHRSAEPGPRRRRVFGGGGVRQIIVELADFWLFVITAGRGTHLAVLADQESTRR